MRQSNVNFLDTCPSLGTGVENLSLLQRARFQNAKPGYSPRHSLIPSIRQATVERSNYVQRHGGTPFHLAKIHRIGL